MTTIYYAKKGFTTKDGNYVHKGQAFVVESANLDLPLPRRCHWTSYYYSKELK